MRLHVNLKVALAVTLLMSAPCFAKPTREQIAAHSNLCKVERRQMDLVAQFGRDFSGLDLSGLDLRGAHTIRMETILTGANFTGAALRNVKFGASNLDGARFNDADLGEADFTTASLNGADFRGAKLAGTRIYQSRLDRANLSRADLSQADITGSSFAGADLSGSLLAGAKSEYWWSDFTGANLAGADLRGLKLAGARFRGADLRGAKLAGADLQQAEFAGANLAGADLNGAQIEAADFRQALGLSEEEKANLVKAAGREAFERSKAASAAADAFAQLAYLLGYPLVIVALLVLAAIQYRRRGATGPWLLSGAINAAALVPFAFRVLMFVGGSSPVAQFNAGSPRAFDLWSTWLSLWPVCLLGVPVGVLLESIAVVWFFARGEREPLHGKRPWLSYALLTLVHLFFVAVLLFASAPDA